MRRIVPEVDSATLCTSNQFRCASYDHSKKTPSMIDAVKKTSVETKIEMNDGRGNVLDVSGEMIVTRHPESGRANHPADPEVVHIAPMNQEMMMSTTMATALIKNRLRHFYIFY